MANNIPLTSIGVKVSYAVEATAGTRPTTSSAYTEIDGLKSTPDFNPAPNTADATSFDNTQFTTKVPLLKELPDTLEFNGNFGQELFNDWEALCTAATTAKASNKATWFCIKIPGFNKCIYFKGEPVSAGLPAMEVNSPIETTLRVVPTGEPTFATAPTT